MSDPTFNMESDRWEWERVNKRTGQVAQFVSDDGETWRRDAAPDVEAEIAATAPEPQPVQMPEALPAEEPGFFDRAATAAMDVPLVRGLVHGGSLGRSDEAEAAGYAAGGPEIPRVTRGIAGVPTGQDDYGAQVDASRDELATMRREHPVQVGVGEALGAGAVTAPLAIAAAPTTAMGLLAEGALLGGGYAAGESEGATYTDVVEDTAEGAAYGGPLNALLPAAGNKLAKGLSKAGDYLAESIPGRRLGGFGARGSDIAKVRESKGEGAIARLAREAEDIGLGGVTSWQGTAKRAEPIRQRAGQRIADLNDAASEAGVRVDMAPIADAFESEGKRLLKTSRLPEMRKEARTLFEYADSLRNPKPVPAQRASARAEKLINEAVEEGNAAIDAAKGGTRAEQETAYEISRELFDAAQMRGGELVRSAANPDAVPFKQAHDMRSWLDGQVWKNRRSASFDAAAGEKAERFRSMASMLRKQIDDGIDRGAGSDVLDALKDANTKYEVASFARDAASKRAAQESGNMPLSLPSMIVGGGVAPFDLKGAALSALATEGVKRYGNSALATTIRGSGRGLRAAAKPSTEATGSLTSAVRRGVVSIGGLADAIKRGGNAVAEALETDGVEAAANEHRSAAARDPKYRAAMLRSINQ